MFRDVFGVIVAAKMKWFFGCMRVEEGEAMGLHETLSWIKNRGLAQVEFETYIKKLKKCLMLFYFVLWKIMSSYLLREATRIF